MIHTKFQHRRMFLMCLKIMEAPQRTLLVLERNSSSSFMVLEQFKHTTNTLTHATTVSSIDLQYHPHLNWSFRPKQLQQEDSNPFERISLCSNGKGIS